MKKKIVSLALVMALVAIVAGGTLAYFTDVDSAENVMTTGSVNIAQNEQEQGENGLVDFTQDKPLMPMVDKRAEGDAVVVDDYFNPNMQNVVDKIITVTNEAEEGAVNQDAYVRTIIAFETANEYEEDTTTVRRGYEEIFNTYIGVLGSGLTYTDIVIEVDGVHYIIAYKVYEAPLAPQETSTASLKQVFLSPEAGNEVAALFGAEYTILALSQGVQVDGFENAGDALDTAFGEINAENVQTWFAE